MAGKPTLLHLDSSQSQRIIWLLEELGIDYELKLFERGKSGSSEGRAPPELKETHPLGKSPQLITAEGRVLIESNVISKYLITTYDTNRRFRGDGAPGNDEIRDDILCEIGNGSLSLIMIVEMLFTAVVKKSPFFLRPLFSGTAYMVHKAFTGPEFDAFFGYLQSELGEQDYFMGSTPGRADFILSWPFDFCTANKFVDLKKYPALDRWYSRCQARDGWKRARSKGNKYKLMV